MCVFRVIRLSRKQLKHGKPERGLRARWRMTGATSQVMLGRVCQPGYFLDDGDLPEEDVQGDPGAANNLNPIISSLIQPRYLGAF